MTNGWSLYQRPRSASGSYGSRWLPVEEGDQVAVVVAIRVLERRDRHVDRLPGDVVDGLGPRVAAEVGVQQVGEAVVDVAVLDHVLGLAEQVVLPGRDGVGRRAGSPAGGSSASGTWMIRLYSPVPVPPLGVKRGSCERCAVDVVGELGVLDPGRPVVQVGDLVVAEAVDVVLAAASGWLAA